MGNKMNHTYAMYWNVLFVLHLILQRGKYDGRKIHEVFIKVGAHLREYCFQFLPLVSTWNTQRFKDLLLSHCYLQVFYFTPAFLIFLSSIFSYFLLKLAKFRPLAVLERTTLKYVFNLVNCNCGSFNFCTAVRGQLVRVLQIIISAELSCFMRVSVV